ncbi:hypothetical protein A9G34_07520 [Gilliamella sp. Choc4-2]|uniref:glycoside hydrolase family 19 protein n=1 Tax=Gilliamella sp. Choc4-2 TaxID=3120237 RepID=UPI00080DAB8D|nr:hypothetical protein [Gilliamella apicola]OCG44008.1 hypothetical protein A9G34_07520 [Gilliamella apicola]
MIKKKDKEGNYIDIETLPLAQGMKGSEFQPNLHVECFTCEDLPKYISQTQEEARKLADEDKTLLAISKGVKVLTLPSQADTTVGTPLKGTKIKVLSKETNINWLQIEIKTSATDKKTLWIENTQEIAKKAKSNGEIELATNTAAWSKHPLQASQLTSSNHNIGRALLLDMRDNKVKTRNNRAVDEQDTLWIQIEKVLDDKNTTISSSWLSTNSEGVKKVSCWDWFDFKQIKENASLKEIYLSAKKTLSRNKDNASLEQYPPTIKETLTLLDQQYSANSPKYAMITTDSFKGLIDKPVLASALSRILINYESEWYGKVNSEGKLPKWEALNSEMTEDANNVLNYLTKGDEAKFDAYINTLETSKQQSVKKGIEELKRKIDRFPKDYKSNPKQKLSQGQIEIHEKVQKLEQKVMDWEKSKEKIKKMLWWDDVAKGLAKLNQTNGTQPENTNTTNTKATPTDSASPATLSADGKAWFIHPIALFNFIPKFCITVDMLKQIFTYVSNNRLDLLQFIVNDINVHMNEYRLNTPLRLSHFFAQIRQEVGSSLKTEENFTYSVSGLKTTYKYFKNNPEDAIKHGYPDGSPKNLRIVSKESQKFVANKAMGDRLGNLGANTDDGWNFRGRGLKQLTGRNNYVDFANGYQEIWGGEYIDFVNNPDLLHTNYKYIVHSGVYFWLKYKLYNIADQGSDESTVNLITEKINQYTKSYKDRYNHFKEIYDVKKIFQNI